MKKLLNKEIKLAASPLSYFFLAGALMTLLPGYPILMGAFFVCFGIFHSFQNAREANDILYTVLLPVKKADCVKAKYAFACFIQMLGFVLMAALTALRMTALKTAEPYVKNALMNATPLFLAFALLIFAAFNCVFITGFFKTGYKLGFPFLRFGIACLLLISAGEALHYLPGLSFFNVSGGERLGLQFALLCAAALLYAGGTFAACRSAEKRFEQIDRGSKKNLDKQKSPAYNVCKGHDQAKYCLFRCTQRAAAGENAAAAKAGRTLVSRKPNTVSFLLRRQ